MKPLFLEIQAFGPFVEKQTVNFEDLSSKGIFLIKGKTGSGKTTIFDAMTFALYGGGSGTDEKSKIGRNDFEQWRCSQAPDTLDTVISFTFSSHGRKYIFTRKLVRKRLNFSTEYEAGEIDGSGNIIPFFNNPKATDLKEKAEEIIGLTKEQFRQVVLLPQGQFERFLTASSEEKTEILNKIFDAETWKRYAQKFFESADSRKKALESEKKAVDISLFEEKLSSIEELNDKITLMKSELSQCNDAHKNFEGEKKQEKLKEDIKLFERFKPLHELQKTKEQLLLQFEDINKKEEKSNSADSAEKIRPFIDAFEKAKKDFDTRSLELSQKENLLPLVKENAEKANKSLDAHEADSPVESYNKTIGKYESKRSAYESFVELEKDFQEAESAYNKAKIEYDELDIILKNLQSNALAKFTAYNKASDDAKSFRTKYYSGIYGEIAATLKENEKCPVCGSTSHPFPAEKSPDSVSKSDMEAKEKEADDTKKIWDNAEAKRKEAEEKFSNKTNDFKELESRQTNSKAKLDAAKDSLIEGISDLSALEKTINTYKNKISAYSEEGKTLQEARDKAKKAFDELNADIQTAKKETDSAKNALDISSSELNKALEENSYSDVDSVKCLLIDADERRSLHEEITSYKTMCKTNQEALSEKEKELSGLDEPDSSKFDERQKEISDESDTYNKQSASLTQEIERLTQKSDNLSKKLEKYYSQIQSAEDDFAFARKLRGDTGIGIQRYVLAIMFNQVLWEANEMLKKIHGGRYSLYRSDSKGNGLKRGLELNVHDSRSPEKDGRPVSMLSGGEKFLVSLALSIGMSTVAQKSGVQIEALFIDEGFGTLDENSIADAMDVLDSVRRSNSMIGIISHVELLEENIPTQLEVIKADSGNRIKVV